YHAVIVCGEKLIRTPFGDETVTIQVHIKEKKSGEKSEEKQPENVPIVLDFPEVLLEDLHGLPPIRQVKFQIDLKLFSAPILSLPEGTKNFVVYCDALDKGLGVVLMQKEKERVKPQLVRPLVMSINLDKILDAQAEAVKEENVKNANLRVTLGIFGNSFRYEYCLPSTDRWASYYTSIKAAPFEILYGRKCRSHICWAKIEESQLTFPVIIHETTEKIVQIQSNMQVASDQQNDYADERHKPLEFQVGDKVMLKVSPWNVHNTFHISNLKIFFSDESLVIPLDEIQVDDNLHFIKEPVEIMDQEIKQLKKSRMPIIKVLWNSRKGPEFK
nr:putative reverse transcriptase domain-containing protein [Tanacetum cinerariifolium]